LSFALVASLLSLTLSPLNANALFWNVVILISLSLALLMAFYLDTPLTADLTEFIMLRLTPLLSHVMWPSTRLLLVCGVFECADDKEMEESIFIDEGLQGVDGDEDEPLLPSTSSPEHVPASTLEAEAPRAITSSTAAVEVSWVEREIVSEPGAPSHIQKAHPP
jgi:hypothetical protein